MLPTRKNMAVNYKNSDMEKCSGEDTCIKTVDDPGGHGDIVLILGVLVVLWRRRVVIIRLGQPGEVLPQEGADDVVRQSRPLRLGRDKFPLTA